jgi:DNA-binding NarL/FixJ family response regulator
MAIRRPRVLVVDDKRANLLALDSVLHADYEVLFVLMDVQMPGMDGFETAMQIKQMEGARDIPIIFVTAIYPEDEGGRLLVLPPEGRVPKGARKAHPRVRGVAARRPKALVGAG